MPPSGLPIAQGETVGPIDAGGGSTYFVYLPKTLAEGSAAPVLFWTGAGKSSAKSLRGFLSAAELTGMVVACSVESKNQDNAFVINNGHTERCLEHMEETLPIDPKRVFFTGSSGGGATAFYNADHIDCAGALPYIGYMPNGKVPGNGDFFYVASGAWDYNRYLSAYAAEELGDKATHRLYPGGHRANTGDIGDEGLCWLYTRELYANGKDRAEERARFEHRFHQHLTEELSEKPHLAYFWTDHLLNLCEVEGQFGEVLKLLAEELAPDQQPYLDGRKALEAFSEEYYAPLGAGGGSKGGHTTPEIEAAAAALAEEFAGVPEIEEIAKELGKKTATF